MNLRILALLSCWLYSHCAYGATGDFYVVNLTADAMSLSSATNQMGEISFLNRGDGNSYNYLIRRIDDSIVEGSFFIGSIAYLDWVQVANEIDVSHSIGYGRFGSPTGTIRIVREAGHRVGSYTISNTPIGTISGQFGIVKLSGIIQKIAGGNYKGLLRGTDNFFGGPEVLGLGPGSNDDFIGNQAGMNYSVSLSPDNTLIISDGTTPNAGRAWSWFRGTYAETQVEEFQLTIETSLGIGFSWTPLTTVSVPEDTNQRIYRLVIEKSP